MNKILCLLILIAIPFFISCEKMCRYNKRPKDLKPIDWENYNDVYTVYWNSYYPCSKRQELGRDTVMIYGWIFKSIYGDPFSDDFTLLDRYTEGSSYSPPDIRVLCFDSAIQYKIQALFDTVDMTKKCYIRGVLGYKEIRSGICCHISPEIFVWNANDIYFR